MAALYTLTILTGAFLLFVVEPMFARMLLPRLGGSPEVWNTAVVFYQLTLLLGYLYTHLSIRWLGVRRQAGLHVILLAAPILVLPLALPTTLRPPAGGDPVGWTFLVMAARLGLPFFVLSATGPLVQRWFAALPHPAARDPYFLYAASNAGSLAGLFAYPFLLEPNLGLREQSRLWTGGYALFALLIVFSALVVRRRARGTGASADPTSSLLHDAGIDWSRRLRWLLLAAVPSSLMLSVTTYLSTDIPPLPLLWVLPLALYLITFIFAFAKRQFFSQHLLSRLLLPSLIVVPLAMAVPGWMSPWFAIPLHLAGFFIASMACHRLLADDRPHASGLTEYYLWLSAGGAAGGIFNALIAPRIFVLPLEYPLGLAAVSIVFHQLTRQAGKQRWTRVAVAGLICAVCLPLAIYASNLPVRVLPIISALAFGLPVLLAVGTAPRRGALALSGAMFFGAAFLYAGVQGNVLYAERSFFGVNRVTLDSSGEYVELRHGTTLHGQQSLSAERVCEPLTYYYPTGPAGQLFASLSEDAPGMRVGIVGLGTGSLVSYSRPGDEWYFYEIDPAVQRVAQNPALFRYLSDCAPDVQVILGDARLSLAREPNGRFDILIMDAYSSDSIPVHLITREALDLYLNKLAPDGLLAFHVSNRFFDLTPVLAELAAGRSLSGLMQLDAPVSEEESRRGKTPSQWVLLARRPTAIGSLSSDARWQLLTQRTDTRAWSDDFSSLLLALKR